MPDHTFPVGERPEIRINRHTGELVVHVGEHGAILVDSDGPIRDAVHEGDMLQIERAEGDLRLTVPAATAVVVTDQRGDVEISGVRRVTLSNVRADVTLAAISEGIEADRLHASLQVAGAPELRARGHIGGDVELDRVATVALEDVGGAASIRDAGAVTIGSVGSDLSVEHADTLTVAHAGGDCVVRDLRGELRLGNVGGDCALDQVGGAVQLGSVGGDIGAHGCNASLDLGAVGGDAEIAGVGGELRLGAVGGDAEIRGVALVAGIGNVGGDLELSAAVLGAVSGPVHILVGGDGRIELPAASDLTVQATVGGELSGTGINTAGPGSFTLVYGAGAARLTIMVGGDLELIGAQGPAAMSGSWQGARAWEGNWANLRIDLEGIGKEFAEEFAGLGDEIAAEVSKAFAGWRSDKGEEWGRRLRGRAERLRERMQERARRMEEQARRVATDAEERAARAEERAAREGERAAHKRVRVRINDREWQFDPDRLDRMKEQARKAAAEGVLNALEAVERAIGRIVPPVPPAPPTPPAPPAPPAPVTGQTIKIETPAGARAVPPPATGTAAVADPPDIAAEREAILRMIAEGRITPEEGDLLLEALGQ